MSKPKKITQYMMDQITTLDPDEFYQLVSKAKLTPEQRKALLQYLGDVQGSPRSTPKEVKEATAAIEAIESKPISHEAAQEPKSVQVEEPEPTSASDPAPIVEPKRGFRLFI